MVDAMCQTIQSLSSSLKTLGKNNKIIKKQKNISYLIGRKKIENPSLSY